MPAEGQEAGEGWVRGDIPGDRAGLQSLQSGYQDTSTNRGESNVRGTKVQEKPFHAGTNSTTLSIGTTTVGSVQPKTLYLVCIMRGC